MQFHLTNEEAAALLNLLTGIIEGDRYPMSRRFRSLRRIRARLPGAALGSEAEPQLAMLTQNDIGRTLGSKRRNRCGPQTTRERMDEQPEINVTQMAEVLAGECPATEIVNTIVAHRPCINGDELTQLLDRARELHARAEEIQKKASALMDVVGEIVKRIA